MLNNLPAMLLVATCLCGLIWTVDRFYLARQRRVLAERELARFDARAESVSAAVLAQQRGELAQQRSALAGSLRKQPAWIEYTGGMFPLLAMLFVLRSFLFEPFNIPSGSMTPTLLIGDFILVNKFAYGIRLPVLNRKVFAIGAPQRGDVMVFRHPEDPQTDLIKRVVGVPGDHIVYRAKRLTVNGQPLAYQGEPDYLDTDTLKIARQLTENLNGVRHPVLEFADYPSAVSDPHNFPDRAQCSYDAQGFACSVPEGEYFMMGDNRDRSSDSRYWGFVPDQNIVGKAVLVWMNLHHVSHVGMID